MAIKADSNLSSESNQCTLCDAEVSGSFEVSGIKIVDGQQVQYQLCTSCFSKRPKINFNSSYGNNDDKDDFWKNVTDKAISNGSN